MASGMEQPNKTNRNQKARSLFQENIANSLLGTYLGMVKDTRDVHRNGKLWVYIPEIANTAENDRNGWIEANYASPFQGATPIEFNQPDHTEYTASQSSYGLWAVPPDVGGKVLVTFVNGSLSKGYWFACAPEINGHHNVPSNAAVEPGLKRNSFYDPTGAEHIPLPVGEHSRTNKEVDPTSAHDENRPIQPYIAAGLRKVGLIHDSVRGTTSSTSMRDESNEIYGMNTPGPRITDPDADQEYYEVKGDKPPFKSSQKKQVYKSTTSAGDQTRYPDDVEKHVRRKGGSSFTMDDHPEHEHVRIKTRSGAQLYIGETDGIIYINNRKGSAWLEFSEDGNIDLYAAKSISIRSQEDLNFRADRDVNIEAGRNMHIKAAADYYKNEDGSVMPEEKQGNGGHIKIQAFRDMDTMIEGSVRSHVKGTQDHTVDGKVTTEYNDAYHLFVQANWATRVEGNKTTEVTLDLTDVVEGKITNIAPLICIDGTTGITLLAPGSNMNLADSKITAAAPTFNMTGKMLVSESVGATGTVTGSDVLSSTINLNSLANHTHTYKYCTPLHGATYTDKQNSAHTGTGGTAPATQPGSPIVPGETEKPLAATPAVLAQIYLKYNIKNSLKPDGTKIYSLSYEQEQAQSICSRYITHEPCREHDNTGKVDERHDEYKTDRTNDANKLPVTHSKQ